LAFHQVLGAWFLDALRHGCFCNSSPAAKRQPAPRIRQLLDVEQKRPATASDHR
jgi:hypothetical protein